MSPNVNAVKWFLLKATNAQLHSGQRRFKHFLIVLNKLPRHVSVSKCHLQGVTLGRIPQQMAAPSEQ
jgi:hypothetical protein